MTWLKKSNLYKLLLATACLFFVCNTYADHLKGGWIKYSYLSTSGGKISYRVSFYQYSSCSEPEKVDPYIYLGIFDAGTMHSVTVLTVPLTDSGEEKKDNFGPCFQNPPSICYIVSEYTTIITVPVNTAGYIITSQRCCRIAGIANVPTSNFYGLSYTVTIPGGANSVDNSPVFAFKDTVAICINTPFAINLGATDVDGDSLVYSLCSGLTGGSRDIPVQPNPSAPPYASIPYNSPYYGQAPLGSASSINTSTGVFSGSAPSVSGTYVVAVCVDEYRKGVYLAHTRKEIHLDIENCSFGGASLKPSYITCNGLDFTFSNESTNDTSYSYEWNFGIPGETSDTSNSIHPTFTYPDTGDYVVKLKVDNNKGCLDSTTTHLKIYPGFITNFSIDGSCLKNPYTFTDLTTTKYGYVNSWLWMFDADRGDTIENPKFIFQDTGFKSITLISTNSEGCIDTAVKTLQVSIGPDVSIKFLDTLICNIDTLQLQASSSNAGAVFKWQPDYNISNISSPTPFVSPLQTTIYNLAVSYEGCTAVDSVKVNVIDHVDLSLPADTSICQTDSITLNPTTDALYFIWSPSESLSNVSIKNPFALPLENTTYKVTGSVGKCVANAAENIQVYPYPQVAVDSNATICYGKTVQLSGTIKADNFTWSPTNTLINTNTLKPLAGPADTTQYVLTATYNTGCLKPRSDTVTVNVIPKVKAFAGNDTIVVINEPVQLYATGGTAYQWSPSVYLNNPDIQNPVAVFSGGIDTMVYNVKVTTPEGCTGEDDIKLYIFETKPEVFVPTAFTPNNDGLNDILKPTVAGMKKLILFNIYNRWGQLLFSTSQEGQGWDGNFNGKKQASGTYVYQLSALDYSGKNYYKKGTVVLIR